MSHPLSCVCLAQTFLCASNDTALHMPALFLFFSSQLPYQASAWVSVSSHLVLVICFIQQYPFSNVVSIQNPDVSVTFVSHSFNSCDFLYIHVNGSSHFTLSNRVCYLLSPPPPASDVLHSSPLQNFSSFSRFHLNLHHPQVSGPVIASFLTTMDGILRSRLITPRLSF